MTNQLRARISLKIAQRSEAKKREAKLRVQNQNLSYFDAKQLRFATLSIFEQNLTRQGIGIFPWKG